VQLPRGGVYVCVCVSLAQVLPVISEPNCNPAIMSSYIHVAANALLHTPDPAVQARSPAQQHPVDLGLIDYRRDCRKQYGD